MDFLRVGLVRYKERLESRDVIVFNLRKGRIYDLYDGSRRFFS